MDQRGLLHGDIAMTIITHPGSCILGFDTHNGLPVVMPPWQRISLIISADEAKTQPGITALTTALELPNNRTAVLIVTRNPAHWPSISPAAKFIAPASFHELAYKMKTNKISRPFQHAFVILDNPDKSWEIAPANLKELVARQPAVGIIVLATPRYAAGLLASLPRDYERSAPDRALAPFLFPLYGNGSEHLADVSGIPRLPRMHFAYRKTSGWRGLTPNTPPYPTRIRQTELALTG
jgi:hypothetical protein